MGDDNVITQAEWVAPAVNGKMLVLSITATSREYDLWSLLLGTDPTGTLGGSIKPHAFFYIDAKADGNDVYYTMSATASKTVDDTAAVAESGTPAFTANAADVIFASTTQPLYVDRTAHRYIQVKCAATKTAYLRIHLSSCLRPGDSVP